MALVTIKKYRNVSIRSPCIDVHMVSAVLASKPFCGPFAAPFHDPFFLFL